jgi:hypothetical protein
MPSSRVGVYIKQTHIGQHWSSVVGQRSVYPQNRFFRCRSRKTTCCLSFQDHMLMSFGWIACPRLVDSDDHRFRRKKEIAGVGTFKTVCTTFPGPGFWGTIVHVTTWMAVTYLVDGPGFLATDLSYLSLVCTRTPWKTLTGETSVSVLHVDAQRVRFPEQ